MKKRILSLLCVLALCLTLLPLSAAAVDMDLWVNGEDILSKSNYTVACGSGTAVWTPSSNTLTLTNATISSGTAYLDNGDYYDYCGLLFSGTNLNLVLVGQNTIELSSSLGTAESSRDGIATNGNITISGSGSLNIVASGDYGYGINASYGTLTIQGGTTEIRTGTGQNCQCMDVDNLNITGGTLTTRTSGSVVYNIYAYDTITVSGGSLNVYAGACALYADNGIVVQGGSIAVHNGGYWYINERTGQPSITNNGLLELAPGTTSDEIASWKISGNNGVIVVNDNYYTNSGNPGTPFADVALDAYYYDSVRWAMTSGVTDGTSQTTFSPDRACTRAQMVTFMWRAAGEPAPTTTTCPFTDVPADAYYRDAVLWAVENGITDGVTPTLFKPESTVTRGQTVTFLWRAEGTPAAAGTGMSFEDVPEGLWYTDAVKWAVENEVTNGITATLFKPDNACTRAQIVTFLFRVASL